MGFTEEVLHSKGDEALEQVSQTGCGHPIAGDIEGETGAISEHPDLAAKVRIHCRRDRLCDL